MDFAAFDFTQLNEMDVREEIVAPLLRQLGYRAGTSNNIIREQLLRYPRAYIGRKNLQRDPELRGKADYICEADGKVRWTIEAKTPVFEISIDDIEQAYTYGYHPEVRAVYFCICNGREIRIYQTDRGPDSTPLLVILYENLNESYPTIENILSPAAVLRDHPKYVVDTGPPLAQGLRSVARITGGSIHLTDNRVTLTRLGTSLKIPALGDLVYAITDGAIERDEMGKLTAFIKTLSPVGSLQKLNEKLGLAQSEYVSQTSALSVDQSKPTIFSSSKQIRLPAGERILDLQTWREVILPINLTCDTVTEARGVFSNRDFKGVFRATLNYHETQVVAELKGKFEAHIT